jgi:uncharacterized lipoprotein NlpE involved in copper resistance
MTKIMFTVALSLLSLVGCGGKQPAATSTSTNAAPAAGSAAGSPDGCVAAGGSCVASVADVACASQPANACADASMICCVMAK